MTSFLWVCLGSAVGGGVRRTHIQDQLLSKKIGCPLPELVEAGLRFGERIRRFDFVLGNSHEKGGKKCFER